MDYLTVKEAAELKGCTERYIQRLVKENKISSEQKINPQNKQLCYMIPVSALPENLQAKWYKQKRTESGLLPEQQEETPKNRKKAAVPQRTFEVTCIGIYKLFNCLQKRLF